MAARVLRPGGIRRPVFILMSVMDKEFADCRRQMLKHPAPFSGGKGAEAH